ncbi:Centrin-1 [Trichoplax sp. H2]|nr:Centrin-1 [Trichoplax sp. H2]|eukprot:RDD44235.1 Centrin-1 [Trichoplax sp. H2]
MQRALRVLGYRLKLDAVQVAKCSASQFSFNDFLEFISDQGVNDRGTFDEISQAFDLFDYDKSGKITLDNLKRAERECGMKLSDHELQNMIDVADCDGDGQISKDEFMIIMQKTCMFSN